MWDGTEDFPGLFELSELFGLEHIVTMDYDTLQNVIQPKFWYIDKWKWKVNALNAMRNAYEPKYESAIHMACNDENEYVRRTARWVEKSVGGV